MLSTQAFFDADTKSVSYLVWEDDMRQALIIDPILDFDASSATLGTLSADKILTVIDEKQLKLERILETHAHADRLSAGDYIRQKTGAPLCIGTGISQVQKTFKPLFMADDLKADGRDYDCLFKDQDSFKLGSETVTVMATPGHTQDSVSYYIGDRVFVGDTLFMPDYGTARADFPGGNARDLYISINKILALPDETRIMVCHDYLPSEGRKTNAWESTVAAQKSENIHLGPNVTEGEFVTMRDARDKTLSVPKMIIPSLQVNIRAGALPPPAKDEHHYLLMPINRLNNAS